MVITDGLSTGTFTPVATVVPVITAAVTNLQATTKTLTITGVGFDPIAASNLVALSSGSGTVTAATSTKLTIALSSPPAVGPLSALVVVDGVSSSFTQVATVIPGPASAATSIVTVSAPGFLAGQPSTVQLQARDALGNNETTGGQKIVFALAAGSAGGSFSVVTDHHNGTYTATFTSIAMGNDSITATLGGVKVTSTAATSVFFQTTFPNTTGPLGTPWVKRNGTFTNNGSGTVTAGTLGANIYTYSGTAKGNVTESVNIASIPVGQTAGLVARYAGAGNANYYLAAITNTAGAYTAVIKKNVAGVISNLGTPVSFTFSGSGTLMFEAVGPSLRLFVNGTLIATATDTKFAVGAVGIWGSNGAQFSGTFGANAINLQAATLPFTDNFAATADGQLSTYWTNQLGNFTVASNQALAAGTAAALNMAIVNGGTAATVSLSMNVDSLGASQSAWLVGRYISNGTMYFAGITANSTATSYTAQVFKLVNGVKTAVGAAHTVTFTPGELLSFTLSGTSLTLAAGATTFTVFDSSITAAGRVGIRTTGGVKVSSFNAIVP